MPSADDQARKQNEANSILDLRLRGLPIKLQPRPSPTNSRPSSRNETFTSRPMSATPTLYYQEKHRKTPPWTRPQSADHGSKLSQVRKKIAARFGSKKESRKNLMNNSYGESPLGGSSLMGDESEISIPPSPDCSKLEPGLAGKPPIHPSIANSSKGKQKSLDDIINIKFQRWFPEAAQPVQIPPSAFKKLDWSTSHDDKYGSSTNLDGAMESSLVKNFQSCDNLDSLDLDSPSVRCPSELSMSNGFHDEPRSRDRQSSSRRLEERRDIEATRDDQLNEREPRNHLVSSRSLDIDNVHDDQNIRTTNGRSLGHSHSLDLNRSSEMYDVRHRYLPSSSKQSPDRKNKSDIVTHYQHEKLTFSARRNSTDLYEESDTFSESLITREEQPLNTNLKTPRPEESLKSEERKIIKKVTIQEFRDDIPGPASKRDQNYDSVMREPPKADDKKDSAREVNMSRRPISKTEFNASYMDQELNIQEDPKPSDDSIDFSNPPRPQFHKPNDDPCFKHADIMSWIGNHPPALGTTEKTQQESSTYDDIMNMIKVLEKEEIESIRLEALSTGRSTNNSVCSNLVTRDILTFLDEVDKTSESSNMPCGTQKLNDNARETESQFRGKLATLLNQDSAELARKVMALQLDMEDKESILENTAKKLTELEQKLNNQKSESEATIKRHQKFIDQLINEKRTLGEQCSSLVKEMEARHKKAMKVVEERHAVELKKEKDKIMAAEKIKREKWVDEKTKKIKEMTVKGLEPELNRMALVHQEELAELRRCHEKELAELESSWNRRLATQRDQALKDREQAVSEEREAARKKLEHEIGDLERSYQEQRRRLLAEVREEKEKLERDAEHALAERNRALEEKWQRAAKELDARLIDKDKKHQEELQNMRQSLEAERQSWLNHQSSVLAEKERSIREQAKKERDKHIEAVIRKLDAEANEKEKSAESKLSRLKEQYEREIRETEGAVDELKRKLKDSRQENQSLEESASKLRTQVSQLQCELTSTKQSWEKCKRDIEEIKLNASRDRDSQVSALQKELADEKNRKEEIISSISADKERELQQVYNRVKEAVAKKDEIIKSIQKQRDAALAQCAQLEKLLEDQRKDFSRYK